uniref:Uncharacterized protein n=1 Tax=Arundo donax TaxID=35708 RepID=A0A0A9E9V8_ARUDO
MCNLVFSLRRTKALSRWPIMVHAHHANVYLQVPELSMLLCCMHYVTNQLTPNALADASLILVE